MYIIIVVINVPCGKIRVAARGQKRSVVSAPVKTRMAQSEMKRKERNADEKTAQRRHRRKRVADKKKICHTRVILVCRRVQLLTRLMSICSTNNDYNEKMMIIVVIIFIILPFRGGVAWLNE